MPFGRGFGFRGWSPPWPYVGRGKGGFPRCWAYGADWGASYATQNWFGAYPHPFTGAGEKEWLKGQAELIRQEIDQIKNRISELEKE